MRKSSQILPREKTPKPPNPSTRYGDEPGKFTHSFPRRAKKKDGADGPVFISQKNCSYRRKYHFHGVEPKQQGGRKNQPPLSTERRLFPGTPDPSLAYQSHASVVEIEITRRGVQHKGPLDYRVGHGRFLAAWAFIHRTHISIGKDNL